MEHKNLAEWIESYDKGMFESRDRSVQCKAGWYDWFCKDSSLKARTDRLAPKVKKIAKSKKIDPTKVYVWFKNNCPMVGTLYDDFRIADLSTGDTIYIIVPRTGRTALKGQAEVWGRENGFESALYEGDWKGVLNFFGVK